MCADTGRASGRGIGASIRAEVTMVTAAVAVETPLTLPGRQLWVVFGGLISVMLLAALDGTPTPAKPGSLRRTPAS